jgi:hypothetical protein
MGGGRMIGLKLLLKMKRSNAGPQVMMIMCNINQQMVSDDRMQAQKTRVVDRYGENMGWYH